MMSPDNQTLVRKTIQDAGRDLEGKLPPSKRHPKGRNPYAHIAKVIIDMTGSSYKDLPDNYLDVVLDIIEHCRINPF